MNPSLRDCGAVLMVFVGGGDGERSGSVLSYVLQPRTPTSSDMPDLMDKDEGLDDEGSKETGELAEDPVPESAPLSEVREIRRWADDPVPIVHSFLVC